MRQSLLIAAILSTFFFPLIVTGALALAAAIFYPLAPLVVGLCLDTLYYTKGVAAFPWYTIYGALAALAIYFVHRFIETSIMRS